MMASRNIRIAAVAAALSIGGLALSSAPSWADTPAGSLAITVLNPSAATVSINPPAGGVTIDATQNISQATAAPALSKVDGSGGDTGNSKAVGDLGLTVQTNSAHGYAVDASDPGGLTSTGNPTVTSADLHLATVTGVTPTAVTVASATLDNPVSVLSATGPSGGIQTDKFPSGRISGQDSTVFGFWILPNALLGGQSYASTINFVFIPAP